MEGVPEDVLFALTLVTILTNAINRMYIQPGFDICKMEIYYGGKPVAKNELKYANNALLGFFRVYASLIFDAFTVTLSIAAADNKARQKSTPPVWMSWYTSDVSPEYSTLLVNGIIGSVKVSYATKKYYDSTKPGSTDPLVATRLCTQGVETLIGLSRIGKGLMFIISGICDTPNTKKLAKAALIAGGAGYFLNGVTRCVVGVYKSPGKNYIKKQPGPKGPSTNPLIVEANEKAITKWDIGGGISHSARFLAEWIYVLKPDDSK